MRSSRARPSEPAYAPPLLRRLLAPAPAKSRPALPLLLQRRPSLWPRTPPTAGWVGLEPCALRRSAARWCLAVAGHGQSCNRAGRASGTAASAASTPRRPVPPHDAHAAGHKLRKKTLYFPLGRAHAHAHKPPPPPCPPPRPSDNIYTLESWLKRKFDGMKEQVDALFREASGGPGTSAQLKFLL